MRSHQFCLVGVKLDGTKHRHDPVPWVIVYADRSVGHVRPNHPVIDRATLAQRLVAFRKAGLLITREVI